MVPPQQVASWLVRGSSGSAATGMNAPILVLYIEFGSTPTIVRTSPPPWLTERSTSRPYLPCINIEALWLLNGP